MSCQTCDPAAWQGPRRAIVGGAGRGRTFEIDVSPGVPGAFPSLSVPGYLPTGVAAGLVTKAGASWDQVRI